MNRLANLLYFRKIFQWDASLLQEYLEYNFEFFVDRILQVFDGGFIFSAVLLYDRLDLFESVFLIHSLGLL